jgi:hypothetical protein
VEAGTGEGHRSDNIERMFDAVPESAAVTQLLSVDPDALQCDELVDYLAAIERLTSHLAARTIGPLVRLLGKEDVPDAAAASGRSRAHLGQAALFEDVRTSLRLSNTVMSSRLEVARALSGEMSATAEALRAGEITALHARTLVEGTRGLSGEQLWRVELLALERGRNGSLADLRRGLRKGNAEIDAQTQARRHEAAMAGREIRRWALDDGMAVLQIVASAIDVDAAYEALTIVAGPSRTDDPRTLRNRRVDAFVELCLAAVAPEQDPGSARPPRRPPVQAQIVIDLTTLLGMDDKAACLRGHGPIAADVAREWLRDATTWRRLVVDPVDGHLLDFGPLVHDPPPRLDRFVRARDQRCVFPGCNRSAIRADLDHQVPFRADGTGGSTSARNLAALCRRHHRLKTHAGWSYVTDPDGSITWTSPSGRTHKVARRPARE